jgi:glutamine synthetase
MIWKIKYIHHIKISMIPVEYVWLDGNNKLRSKTKIIHKDENPPVWNYDGSSTYQASTSNSEIDLIPIKRFNDPTRNNGIIVLCKTSYDKCTMATAEKIFIQSYELFPMFGLEQEFFIIDNKTGKPLGWPKEGEPKPQGEYYCSVGVGAAFGRDYLEECLDILIRMKVPVTGMNYELAPGQAEFQVCDVGINAAHALTMLRYVLARVGEKYNYSINYDPKPIAGDWNGSGCHVNFSTKPMRDKVGKGLEEIYKAIKYLETSHLDDIKLYGKDNEKRLTGKHETSSMEKFTYGVSDRGASIRIPIKTMKDKMGYFEDRRPAANIDPYLVTANIYKVCCLDHKSLY